MVNTINIKRIGLYLKYTTISEGQSLLITGVLMSVISCLISWIVAYLGGLYAEHNTFILIQFLAYMILVAGSFFKQLRNTGEAISYLTMPVSLPERFLVIFVWMNLVLPITFLFIYVISSSLLNPLGEYITGAIILPVHVNLRLASYYLSIVGIIPVFVYGALCIKKSPAIKTLFLWILWMISIIMFVAAYAYYHEGSFSSIANNITQSASHFGWANCALFWAMIYFGLKEKEA